MKAIVQAEYVSGSQSLASSSLDRGLDDCATGSARAVIHVGPETLKYRWELRYDIRKWHRFFVQFCPTIFAKPHECIKLYRVALSFDDEPNRMC